MTAQLRDGPPLVVGFFADLEITRDLSNPFNSLRDQVEYLADVGNILITLDDTDVDYGRIILTSSPMTADEDRRFFNAMSSNQFILGGVSPSMTNLSTAYRVGGPLWSARDLSVEGALREVESFFLKLWGSRTPDAIAVAWMKSSEALITQLDVVLREREDLKRLLTQALGDKDIAEARVVELEHALALLERERNDTHQHRLPRIIGAVALTAALILHPLATMNAPDGALKNVKRAHATALQLHDQCNQASDVDPTIPYNPFPTSQP